MTNYLPLEHLNVERVRIFEQRILINAPENEYQIRRVYGLLSMFNKQQMHEYRGFNKFTISTIAIPSIKDQWLSIEDESYIRMYFEEEFNSPDEHDEQMIRADYAQYLQFLKHSLCNPQTTLANDEFARDAKYDHADWYLFKTLVHGEVGFHVYVNQTTQQIDIYQRTCKVIPLSMNGNEDFLFDSLVSQYHYSALFIGQSGSNHLTHISEAQGSNFDGNAILFRVGSELNYVFVGHIVAHFSTSEPITHFVSSVGQELIAYPYAESEHKIYDFVSMISSQKCEHASRHEDGYLDNDKPTTGEPIQHQCLSCRTGKFVMCELDPTFVKQIHGEERF